MASNHYEDSIFQEKRKPKTPIKFKTELNLEQKEAKAKILQHTVTLLAGSAGSGKTFLACQIALEKLFMKEAEKIIITRPTVSKEEIGFLPGDLREKMDPWVQPIYQNMYALYDKVKVEQHIQAGQIEIVPLSFMRGHIFRFNSDSGRGSKRNTRANGNDCYSIRFTFKNDHLWRR